MFFCRLSKRVAAENGQNLWQQPILKPAAGAFCPASQTRERNSPVSNLHSATNLSGKHRTIACERGGLLLRASHGCPAIHHACLAAGRAAKILLKRPRMWASEIRVMPPCRVSAERGKERQQASLSIGVRVLSGQPKPARGIARFRPKLCPIVILPTEVHSSQTGWATPPR